MDIVGGNGQGKGFGFEVSCWSGVGAGGLLDSPEQQ